MYNYALLDLGFMLLAASLLCHEIHRNVLKKLLLTLVLIVALTAVFDQPLIVLDIVKYHASELTGLYIAKAPIEDFAYSIVAAIMMPLLWQKAKHHD